MSTPNLRDNRDMLHWHSEGLHKYITLRCLPSDNPGEHNTITGVFKRSNRKVKVRNRDVQMCTEVKVMLFV